MGQVGCYKFQFGLTKPTVKILLHGPGNAGKTTILYYLLLGEAVTTIPTIAFNVEKIECENMQCEIWDMGGGDKIRPLWKYYYSRQHGLIWTVDCSDRESMSEVKHEFDLLLEEEVLKDIPLLVFANKQDLPGAMTALELVDQLGLRALENRRWHVQYSCAIRGEGLWKGLKWLTNEITKRTVEL